MTTPPISPPLAPIIHVPSGEKAPDSREAPLSMRLNKEQTERLDALLNRPVLRFKDGSFVNFHAVIQRLREKLGCQLFLIGSANATIIAGQEHQDLDLYAEMRVDNMHHLREVADWIDHAIHEAIFSLLPPDEQRDYRNYFQMRCNYFKGRLLVAEDPPADPRAKGAKFGNRFSYFNIGGLIEIKIAYNLPDFSGLEYPFAFTKDGLRLPLDPIGTHNAPDTVEMVSIAGPINHVVECLEKRILLCDCPNGTEFPKWLDLVTLRGYQDSMLGKSIFEQFKGIIKTPEERAEYLKKKFEKRNVVLPILLNLAHFDPTLREQICPSKKAVLELYLKQEGLYLIDYTPSQLLKEAIAEGSIAHLEELDLFAPLVGEGVLREARYQLITSIKSDEEAWSMFCETKGKDERMLFQLCKRSLFIRQKVLEKYKGSKAPLDVLLQTEHDPEQLVSILMCTTHLSEPVRKAFLVVLEKLPYSEQIVKKACTHKEFHPLILRQILKVPSGEMQKFLDLLKEAKVVFDLDKVAFSEEELQYLLQKMSDEEALAFFNFAKGKKEPLLLLLCKRSSWIRQKVAEKCGDAKLQLDILFQTEEDPKQLALLLLRAHHYSEPVRTAFLIVLENKNVPYSEELVEKALNHKAFVKDHRQILVKQILKIPNDQIYRFLEKLKSKEIPLDIDIASLSDEECRALLKKVPYCHEAQCDTLGLQILKKLGITNPLEYILLLPRGFFGLSDTSFLPFYIRDAKSPEDVVIQLLNTLRMESLQFSLFHFALKEKLLPDPDRVLAQIIIFIQMPEIRRDFWKLAQDPGKMVDFFLKGETAIENITLFLSAKSIPNTPAVADAYERLLTIQKSGACLCKALKNHFFREMYGPLILERLRAMTEEELTDYFPKMAPDLKKMPLSKADVRQEMLLHLLQSKLPMKEKWRLLNQEDFKNAAIVSLLITLLLMPLETAKIEGEIDAILPFAGELLRNTTPELANLFHEDFFHRYTHLPAITPALYQFALDLLRQMKEAPLYPKYLKNFAYTCLRIRYNGQIKCAFGLTLEALKTHQKEDALPILRLFYDAFPANGMEAEGLWTFAFAEQLDQELFGPLTEDATERLTWLVNKLPHSFRGWDTRKQGELRKILLERYLSKNYFVDECIKQVRIFPLLQTVFLPDLARSTRLCCHMLIALDLTNLFPESVDLLQGILDQLNHQDLSDLSAIDPFLQLSISRRIFGSLNSGSAEKLRAYPYLLPAFYLFFLLTMPRHAKFLIEKNLVNDLEDLRYSSKNFARALNSERVYHEVLKLTAVAYFRQTASEDDLFYYCCSPLHIAFLVEYAHELFAEYPVMSSLNFARFKPLLFKLRDVLRNPRALEGYYKGDELVLQCFNLYELAQAKDEEAITIFREFIAILEQQKADEEALQYLHNRLSKIEQGSADSPPSENIGVEERCNQLCALLVRSLNTRDAGELVLCMQRSAEALEEIAEHVKSHLPAQVYNALLGWAYKINTHLPKNACFPKNLDTLQGFISLHINGLLDIFHYICGQPFDMKKGDLAAYIQNILVPALFAQKIDPSAS